MVQTAILYIAERCNQSCVFCLEEDGSWRPFVDPSTTEVMDQVTALFARGARHITFMGGETFFRKDLGRILEHARAAGFTRVGVTTNGTVLSKKGFIQELAARGLAFIELSIHGHTAELANAIGGTHFTFERQAAALAELDEIKTLPAIVNVVVCRENKDHLVDIARHVCEKYPNIPARFKLKFVSLLGLAAKSAEPALRYSEVDFIGVGDYLEKRGVPFWFYNVPMCRLGRHARRSHELGTMAGDERYFDFDHRGAAEYYDSGHQIEGRVWPEGPCSRCSLRPVCPGIEETLRRVAGDGELATQGADPLDCVRFALSDRGLDPAAAEERLLALRGEPRPSRFIRRRSEGALRFRHASEPEPLDLMIEEQTSPPRRAFAQTARFTLGYRAWSGEDAAARPRVAALLEMLVPALEKADAAGMSIADARAAVAADAMGGWSVEIEADTNTDTNSNTGNNTNTNNTKIPRRKGGLPVVPPDAAPGPRFG